MAGILVFSEKDDTAFELVSKGRQIKGDGRLAALVLADASEEKAKQYFAYGADVVYMAKPDVSTHVDAHLCADAIARAIDTYGFGLVLIGSTRAGKEIAAMVAQRLGVGCVTDAIDINIRDGKLVVDRYSFGGSTVASLVVKTARQVISVMPRTFELAPKTAAQGEIVTFAPEVGTPKVKVVDRQEKKGESTPIEEAETLVCIGRGIADKKDIPMIEALTRSLKAEIGCTRPLTHEWMWFPESREVGLSGKKCKPSLCLSLGISGQIQHTVGIRTSKIIAAINKDKNAPIFKTADYGIVADLYDVVPKLTRKIIALAGK